MLRDLVQLSLPIQNLTPSLLNELADLFYKSSLYIKTPYSNYCIHYIGLHLFCFFLPIRLWVIKCILYALCVLIILASGTWLLQTLHWINSWLNEFVLFRAGEQFEHQGSIQGKRGEGERCCCAHWSEFHLLPSFIRGWAFVPATTWAELCVLKVRPLICNAGCYLQNP